MWQTLLRYIPTLAVNAVGPILELLQAKNAKRLKQIKVYCDQVNAGMLTPEQGISLILEELK